MKKILFLLLANFIFDNSFAQDPPEACCSILIINTENDILVARDNKTGRLFRFRATAEDMNNIKKGDAVNINLALGKISAIRNGARDYLILQPDNAEPAGILTLWKIDGISNNNGAQPKMNKSGMANVKVDKAEPAGATPCCSIISIEPDGAQPCCSIVSFMNTSGNWKFHVPVNFSKTLQPGQPVYAEPINQAQADNLPSVTGNKRYNERIINASNTIRSDHNNYIVIIQSTYGNNNGELASYGFPAISADDINNVKATDKWVISPAKNLKGITGRLDMNFSDGVDWNIWIYTMTDEFVNSFYQTHNTKSFSLAAGQYRIKLGNVTVDNVPLLKGHVTRIKAGYLNVVSEGGWTLYDETKTINHSSNVKPQKIALPVGMYQLDLGGQFFPLIIKDGETVEM